MKSIHEGYLILVNPEYLLHNNTVSLVPFSSTFKDILLDAQVNERLHAALNSIHAKDAIVPISGYRSLQEQTKLYNECLLEHGEEYTKKFVALPNASEHQTGYAIDLALHQENIDFICPSFPYTGICQMFRDIAQEFGFIERYAEEKKHITKIAKEEWHFRYVGYPHAKIMKEQNLCLEEYIGYLKQFMPSHPLYAYGYQIFYVKDISSIKNIDTQEISGNNIDGYIVSEKVYEY